MFAEARTGWYGKLPTLGDFASRRLAPELIEAWDAWLAGGIAQWREEAPESWLQAYLDGPSWRFVLMPGVLPGVLQPLTGVLMPSVDRVGRYFPMTLMRPLLNGAPPGSAAHLSWLHRLDDLALDAMQEDWDITQMETELQRLDEDVPAATEEAAPLLPPLQAGQSFWWRIGDEGRRLDHLSSGLPQGTEFVALLSGQLGSPPSI